MDLQVIHWDSAWGPLTEAKMRQRLISEGYSVFTYYYTPGTYFPPHTHAVDKKDTVLQGQLKIAWEGGFVILQRGDMIEIPAGASHSAEVASLETVVSLDATKETGPGLDRT